MFTLLQRSLVRKLKAARFANLGWEGHLMNVLCSGRTNLLPVLVLQLQTQLFRELATRGQNWTMSRNKARKRELSVHKPGRLARGGHGRAPAIELHLFESAAMCFTQSERSLRSFLGPEGPTNLPHGLGVPKKKTTNPRTSPVDNVYNGRRNQPTTWTCVPK